MYILPFFIAIVIFVTVGIKLAKRKEAKARDSFWENEAKANNTRKVNIDNLPYISIPLDRFNMESFDNETISQCQASLKELSNARIINFSGITNTELKLKYGAANLEYLSEYDQNFTELCRTLYSFGNALYEEGLLSDAKTVLEFGISCKTDITSHYNLLAKIYKEENTPRKIEHLISMAEGLNCLMKPTILKNLRSFQ